MSSLESEGPAPRVEQRQNGSPGPAEAGSKARPRSVLELEDRFVDDSQFYEPGSIEDLHFRFTRRLIMLARQWKRRLDERLKAIGQTQARWAVLFWISVSDDATTQQSLAERIGIEGPTLVFILNRLEQEGLVARMPVENDRRAKKIVLTEAAQPVLDRIREITAELRAEIFKEMTPAELELCISVFNRLRHGLEGA